MMKNFVGNLVEKKEFDVLEKAVFELSIESVDIDMVVRFFFSFFFLFFSFFSFLSLSFSFFSFFSFFFLPFLKQTTFPFEKHLSSYLIYFMLRLCREQCLPRTLVYIYTEGLRDFVGPIEFYLPLLVSQPKSPEEKERKEKVVFFLFFFLFFCFFVFLFFVLFF